MLATFLPTLFAPFRPLLQQWASYMTLVTRPSVTKENSPFALGSRRIEKNSFLITPQAKRNLSSRSGIGGVLSAT